MSHTNDYELHLPDRTQEMSHHHEEEQDGELTGADHYDKEILEEDPEYIPMKYMDVIAEIKTAQMYIEEEPGNVVTNTSCHKYNFRPRPVKSRQIFIHYTPNSKKPIGFMSSLMDT